MAQLPVPLQASWARFSLPSPWVQVGNAGHCCGAQFWSLAQESECRFWPWEEGGCLAWGDTSCLGEA